MQHLPSLIHDLAIILGIASIVSIVFRKINQPVILGYILVGFLVSPHVPIFPTITDDTAIKIWAELGIIFLLFGLGLEFSFRKLLTLGPSPIITGIFEITMMMTFGYFLGRFLSLSKFECFFLGGMLAISSTTVILKTFEEKRLKFKKFASQVLGILIIEDLAAVLIIVFLTGIATTNTVDSVQIAYSFIKLLFFLIIWFVSGIVLIPSLLKTIKRFLNDETVLILGIALCLSMTLLVTSFGFSSALGAFLMGSMLAETSEGKKIEKLIHSIKSLFGAIFFVSVGILIHPQSIYANWQMILIISTFVILGKFVFVSIGSLVSGNTLKISLRTGMSMTQIGEFSFIIAGLGMTLHATGDHLYPVAVAVAVITTFTTPYLVTYSEPVAQFIERKIPKPILENIYRYFSSTQIIKSSSSVRKSILKFFIHSIVQVSFFIALTLMSLKFIQPLFLDYFTTKSYAIFITYSIAVFFSAPFMWAFIREPSERYLEILKETKKLRPLYHGLKLFSTVIFVALVTAQFSNFYTKTWLVVISLAAYFILFKILSHVNSNIYHSLENLFLQNFLLNNPVDKQRKIFIPNTQEPWDIHLSELTVSEDFPDQGKTLEELSVRERFGVSIAMIQRHGQSIPTPMKYERLFRSDVLSVIGNEEQLSHFSHYLNQIVHNIPQYNDPISHLVLDHIHVHTHSTLKGKTIRASGLREETSGLVVGIERLGKKIVNPDSMLIFNENDIVWIAGAKDKIKKFNS